MKLTKSIDISHNMYQKSNDVNYVTTSFNNKYYKNLTRNNKNSSQEKKRKLKKKIMGLKKVEGEMMNLM